MKARKPKEAIAFYTVRAMSVAIGIALNFTAIDPIQALYCSAVINGILAAPVMTIMMFLIRKRSVMGDLIIASLVYWLGWVAAGAKAFAFLVWAFPILRNEATALCTSMRGHTVSVSFMSGNHLTATGSVMPNGLPRRQNQKSKPQAT